MARARAAGDEPRSVIAGYHWFTDWGRDTMISLEGLTLATGRWAEAGCILRTFAHYVRDGLIPNMFPEGAQRGLYHTADATLWFFHALDRYVAVSHDHATLTALLPKLVEIAGCHMRGTRSGSALTRLTACCAQGAEGYQLTWMDAKVGDWVVTPRRGKAVEINALWYNALRLLTHWLTSAGRSAEAREWDEAADRVFTSFNNRFWNPDATVPLRRRGRRGRQRPGVPAESGLCDLTRVPGARSGAVAVGPHGRTFRAAHAARASDALAETPRLQGDLRRRFALA